MKSINEYVMYTVHITDLLIVKWILQIYCRQFRVVEMLAI